MVLILPEGYESRSGCSATCRTMALPCAAIATNPRDSMYAAKIENNAVKVFDKHTGSLKRIL